MANGNQPRQRRSFRVVLKIFKFILALMFTFMGSFAATLLLKSDHPADYLGSIGEEFFPAEETIQTRGAPEIKTLFDEQNQRPFDRSKYSKKNSDTPEETAKPEETAEPEKISTAEKNSDDVAEREDDVGLIGRARRMMSIKPAVDKKVRSVQHYVPISRIPKAMCQAIVAVEDTRFYEHGGYDLFSIARALFVNVEAGEIQQGASTITQQTVKNLFLTSDRTFSRKFEELILAKELEKNFSKEQILEIYLNSIYFGSNFYGIYDAAQGYFDKEPEKLTVAECAMLAGLPNAPSRYSPYVNFHLAKERQLVVIDAMEHAKFLDRRAAESARIEEITLAK